MAPKPLPLLAKLQELFTYDPHTGLVRWRVQYTNRVKPGMVAGKFNPITGHIAVQIDGERYYAHRIAWALHHGEEPPPGIDHHDGNGANNRAKNLRPANQTQNSGNSRKARNNTSGFKGVHYDPKRRKFSAHIRINGRLKWLGRFDTARDAKAAYDRVGRDVWGLYFNPG